MSASLFLNPIETSLKNAPGALYLLIGLYVYVRVRSTVIDGTSPKPSTT